jgi:hypothetical protein
MIHTTKPLATMPLNARPLNTSPLNTKPLNTKPLSKLSVTEVAEVLFAAPLGESDNLAPAQLTAVVKRTWIAGGADCGRFAAQLAQEAGDHPEDTARRMRWALNAAAHTLHAQPLPLAG